jgi:hypothetical protein
MNGGFGGLWNYVRRFLSQRSESVVTTFQARLPSRLEEAQFQATIRMAWLPGALMDGRRRATAELQLLEVARAAAQGYSVLNPDEARAAIDLALFDCGQTDADTELVAADAKIEVNPHDRRMAEDHEDLRRETALAREARREEVERLKLLADQVLATPTLARLWWLEGKPEKLELLVAKDKGEIFEKVAELFGASAEPPATDPIAELIRLFLEGLDARLREHLISQLPLVFTSYERGDLADRLDSYQHTRTYPGVDVSIGNVDRHASSPGLG